MIRCKKCYHFSGYHNSKECLIIDCICKKTNKELISENKVNKKELKEPFGIYAEGFQEGIKQGKAQAERTNDYDTVLKLGEKRGQKAEQERILKIIDNIYYIRLILRKMIKSEIISKIKQENK